MRPQRQDDIITYQRSSPQCLIDKLHRPSALFKWERKFLLCPNLESKLILAAASGSYVPKHIAPRLLRLSSTRLECVAPHNLHIHPPRHPTPYIMRFPTILTQCLFSFSRSLTFFLRDFVHVSLNNASSRYFDPSRSYFTNSI